MRPFLLLTCIANFGCQTLNPIPVRFSWLTSPSAVTLEDFKTIFNAPSGFMVTPDDCKGVSAGELTESLVAIDQRARDIKAVETPLATPFWVAAVSDIDESHFSFVSTDAKFTAAGKANYSGTPTLRADLESHIGTVQLVFGVVRRRVDLSPRARACLAAAALRACGGKQTPTYVTSILYGSLVRAGSKSLKLGGTANVTFGQPFELKMESGLSRNDMSGGFIGRLAGDALLPKDVQRQVTQGVGAIDLPEMIELAKQNRVIELGTRLSNMTERFGAIAVATEQVECQAPSR